MVLTIGTVRLARTRISNTASSAIESELPGWITGKRSAMCSPNHSWAMRGSCAFIQLILPRSVLISPLCASMRKGWASHQVGKVLVE